MKLSKAFFGFMFALTLSINESRANGATVAILLSTGETITGELLSVRDSSIIISTSESFDERELESIATIRNQDIETVIIEGESKVLQGMGLGVLIGGGIGALIGLASGDDTQGFIRFSAGEHAAIGAVLFGGVGFVIGTIAGIATSTGDKMMEALMDYDFSSLKTVARFPVGEPEYLRAIK